MKPFSRPQMSREQVIDYLIKHGLWKDRDLSTVVIVGFRGYYEDSMGKPNRNDRGIYDDALFVISPELFVSYNANTDPSRYRLAIATLLPGKHPYKKGLHGFSRKAGPYRAFRPATSREELPVKRDGESRIPSARPGRYINLHCGGKWSTSSDGCQTIVPEQWGEFRDVVYQEMDRLGQTTVNYYLIEQAA